MHTTPAAAGKVVDHISGNKLDNTRANLRNITQGQNIRNKAKCFGSTSIYKGVYYERGDTDGRVHGKSFPDALTQVEAARCMTRMVDCSGSCPAPAEEWLPTDEAPTP
jgi:hypothetical protein